RVAGIVSLVSGGVNLVAIAAMGLVLAPATPAGGGLAARAAYLADHRAAVAAGWLCWMAASLCLLAHFASLRLWLVQRGRGTWAAAAVGRTGGVANTLYAIAGALFTGVLFRAAVPRVLAGLGGVTWGVAALATLALAFAPAALPVAVAFSIFFYVAWAWAIGAWCLWGIQFEARGAGEGKVRAVSPWFDP